MKISEELRKNLNNDSWFLRDEIKQWRNVNAVIEDYLSLDTYSKNSSTILDQIIMNLQKLENYVSTNLVTTTKNSTLW